MRRSRNIEIESVKTLRCGSTIAFGNSEFCGVCLFELLEFEFIDLLFGSFGLRIAVIIEFCAELLYCDLFCVLRVIRLQVHEWHWDLWSARK